MDSPDPLFPAAPDVASHGPDDPAAAGRFARAAAAVAATGEAQLIGLIARLSQRDGQALTMLYDATSPSVWSAVLRHVRGDWVRAEEVVDEIYWQAWLEAPRFDPTRATPLAWLLAIAHSQATDAQCGACCRVGQQAEPGAAAVGPAPQPPELPALMQEAQRLRLALARLGLQERELLALAFFRGLTHNEIASKMALPPAAVTLRIRQALQMLCCPLDEPGSPDDGTAAGNKWVRAHDEFVR